MPRKHPRPDADVDRLAAEFASKWVAADGIEPWLRRHVPRLTLMVQDEGWSWADIARAMTRAGISYGTGRPWTGTLLATKAAQVRAQRKVRARKRALAALEENPAALLEAVRAQAGQPAQPARPRPSPVPAAPDEQAPDVRPSPSETSRPRVVLTPARPRGPVPPPAPKPPPEPVQSGPQAAKTEPVSVEDAMEMLERLGRDSRRAKGTRMPPRIK